MGIVFCKITRPHPRTQTLLFSRKAVVAMRDGCLTLQFRVSDVRKSPLVSARLWAVVRGLSDSDDEADQTELFVTFNGSSQNLSTAWPTTVVSSPLAQDCPPRPAPFCASLCFPALLVKVPR